MSKKHMPFEVANEIFGGLSDGAYFAAMEEQGWEPSEFPQAHNAPVTRKCRQCGKAFAGKKARNQHERDKHSMHGAP